MKRVLNFYWVPKTKFGALLPLVISLQLCGCASPKMSNIKSYYTPIPQSTKALDIPKYDVNHRLKGYPYTYWHFSKQKQRQLKLDGPETSPDSLIFRMWITNPVGKKGQPHGLVELRKDSSEWSGQLILMHVDFNLNNLSETITDSKVIKILPLRTDWRTVIDSLFKLRFDVLPTDDLIPGYYPNNSGYSDNTPTFSFEYATKDTYRFYQYNNLNRAADKFWQPKNVIDIMGLLEEEFKWDSIARDYF